MSKRKTDVADDRPKTAHAFADGTKRFALDALLRANGFGIKYRRAGAEPVWTRYGIDYPQTEAVKDIPADVLQEALADEDDYWQSLLA